MSILVIQFCPKSVDKVYFLVYNKGPKNFGFCVVHSVSKILVMVYITIHFEALKFELI